MNNQLQFNFSRENTPSSANNQATIGLSTAIAGNPPDDTLPPGTLLNHDKYRIEHFLGRGGFGVTYMALDQSLGLRVAVKECLPRAAAWRNASAATVQWNVSAPERDAVLENFVKEARKMAKIDQIPGVVRVREYFYDNDTAYIVMDYVDGETLEQYLSRTGSMSAEECFRLLSPVMDSLALAHGHGLIHRDISPNNIMIERNGKKVWLLDLGAAKDMGARAFAPNVSNGTQIVGTPGYTPLEQYDPNGKIGVWTDIYALSATFVHCLTGQTLPPSTSRAMKDDVPERLRPVPGKVSAALMKGLSQNPQERYQTMTELRNALEKAIITPPPPKFPKKALLLTVVLVLLALIPVSIVLLRQPSAKILASGECGEKASWTLDETGLLTISGKGDMTNYDGDFLSNNGYNAPWFDNADDISDIRIRHGITSIGACAFLRCINLTSVTIPNSVTEIGSSAFEGCASLKSITIPDSVTAIGNGAFKDCDLRNVIIPDGVTEIASSAFEGCARLESIMIPDSVTEIGMSAFSGCQRLKSVTIPDGVTTIKTAAFQDCSDLESVDIPDSVSNIGWSAFARCTNLTSVTIPNNVTEIQDYTFYKCSSLESVTIPDSVIKIGLCAFQSCNSLLSVTIPDSVQQIGAEAFRDCANLKSASVGAHTVFIENDPTNATFDDPTNATFGSNTVVTRR